MAARMCLVPTSAARQQAHIVALTQPVIAPLFEARRTTKPLLWIASPFLSFPSNKAAGMGRDHHHSPSALKIAGQTGPVASCQFSRSLLNRIPLLAQNSLA